MTTRIGNGGAAVNTGSPQQVEERRPVLAFPFSQPQAKKTEFRDRFESQGARHTPFQASVTPPRADLKTVSLAELVRTGGASVPSTGQAEKLVKEAYAEVMMREPDADGAQMYKEKALELARNGASEDEIRGFLEQELASSPEGQVIAAVNQQFQSELGRTPETKGHWHEQALEWQGQGSSMEEINQRINSALHDSPERVLQHPQEFLDKTYQRLLGRGVDSEGVATFGAKMKEMNEAGASFEDIQKAIEQDVMASPEYQTRQAQQASSTPGTSGSTPADLKGITPSQITDAAGFSDQWSLCGPIAAVAASRATGKPVSLEQARSVALQGGNYTPGDGMHGAESEVRLLKDLGIPSHTETPVNWDKVKEQLQAGKPVIISTPAHYFVIEGYNEKTGKFDCGNSALAMKASGGTQTELSPSELASWGGGTPTAIILD
ncbi:C39 family peptidase [Hyalangium sp.]|uniref:C39 family peptidase n=1 Tax=Hyalangium sp. TaxID=2028555 RepID=UPI002D623D98|nr:C39 family peptidase [Hyalangium sp.]HYH98495.1 C39 family peptidase [Hyalangium sp.]